MINNQFESLASRYLQQKGEREETILKDMTLEELTSFKKEIEEKGRESSTPADVKRYCQLLQHIREYKTTLTARDRFPVLSSSEERHLHVKPEAEIKDNLLPIKKKITQILQPKLEKREEKKEEIADRTELFKKLGEIKQAGQKGREITRKPVGEEGEESGEERRSASSSRRLGEKFNKWVAKAPLTSYRPKAHAFQELSDESQKPIVPLLPLKLSFNNKYFGNLNIPLVGKISEEYHKISSDNEYQLLKNNFLLKKKQQAEQPPEASLSRPMREFSEEKEIGHTLLKGSASVPSPRERLQFECDYLTWLLDSDNPPSLISYFTESEIRQLKDYRDALETSLVLSEEIKNINPSNWKSVEIERVARLCARRWKNTNLPCLEIALVGNHEGMKLALRRTTEGNVVISLHDTKSDIRKQVQKQSGLWGKIKAAMPRRWLGQHGRMDLSFTANETNLDEKKLAGCLADLMKMGKLPAAAEWPELADRFNQFASDSASSLEEMLPLPSLPAGLSYGGNGLHSMPLFLEEDLKIKFLALMHEYTEGNSNRAQYILEKHFEMGPLPPPPHKLVKQALIEAGLSQTELLSAKWNQQTAQVLLQIGDHQVAVSPEDYLELLDQQKSNEFLISDEILAFCKQLATDYHFESIPPVFGTQAQQMTEKVIQLQQTGKASLQEIDKKIEDKQVAVAQAILELSKEIRQAEKQGEKAFVPEKRRLEEEIKRLRLEKESLEKHHAALRLSKYDIEKSQGRIEELTKKWERVTGDSLKEKVAIFQQVKEGLLAEPERAEFIKEVIADGEEDLYHELYDHLRQQAYAAIKGEMASFSHWKLIHDLSEGDQRPDKLKNLENKDPAAESVTANIRQASEKWMQERAAEWVVVPPPQEEGYLEASLQLHRVLDRKNLQKNIGEKILSAAATSLLNQFVLLWRESEARSAFVQLEKQPKESELPKLGEREKFQQWLEAHTGKKTADFIAAGFPIDSVDLASKKEKQIEQNSVEEQRNELRELINKRKLKEKLDNKIKPYLSQQIEILKKKSIEAQDRAQKKQQLNFNKKDLLASMAVQEVKSSLQSLEFLPFQPLSIEGEGRSFSSIKHLSENPPPSLDLVDDQIILYLHALQHPALENSRERLIAFTQQLLIHRLKKKIPLSLSLAKMVASLIERAYIDPGKTLQDSMKWMDNRERTECLKSVIALACLEGMNNKGEIVLSSERRLRLMQWSRLLLPPDETLKNLILTAGIKEQPLDDSLVSDLLTQMQTAIFSSVGFEAIEEGMSAIRDSLAASSAIDNDEKREMLEQCQIRALPHLSVHLFTHYYSGETLTQALGSPNQREQLERIFRDTYDRAEGPEHIQLLSWLDNAINQPFAESALFPANLFLRFIRLQHTTLPQAEDLSKLQTHIDTLTISTVAEEKLFGLALSMRLIAAQLRQNPGDKENKLWAELACTRLAYEMIRSQIPEKNQQQWEKHRFYRHLFHGASSDMRQLEERMVGWLSSQKEFTSLKEGMNRFVADNKLDGSSISITNDYPKVDPKLPGFLMLSPKGRWDVLHGVLYQGEVKPDPLPPALKSDARLYELQLHELPFEQKGEAYVYSENGVAQVIVKAQEGRPPIIQRLMRVAPEKEPQLLQYIDEGIVKALPLAVKDRLGIAQYWIDEAGTLHGYDEAGRSIVTLSKEGLIQGDRLWRYTPHRIDDLVFSRLTQLLPFHEILTADDGSGYWIPAWKMVIRKTAEGNWKCEGGPYDGMFLNTEEDGVVLSKTVSFSQKKQEENKKLHLKREKASHFLNKNISLQGMREAQEAKQQFKKELRHITTQRGEILLLAALTDPQKREASEGAYWEAKEKLEQQYQKYVEESDVSQQGVAFALYQDAYQQFQEAKEQYDRIRGELPVSYTYQLEAFTQYVTPTTPAATFHLASLAETEERQLFLLSSLKLEQSLTFTDLEALRTLRKKRNITSDASALLLNLLELRHLQLARQEALSTGGKWDRERHDHLKKEIHQQAEMIKPKNSALLEAWREVESEFNKSDAIHTSFSVPSPVQLQLNLQQMSLIENVIDTPIDRLGFLHDVSYVLKDVKIDHTQKEVAQRLKELEVSQQGKEENEAQEGGFYFENFGLFDDKRLLQQLRISDKQGQLGIGKLDRDTAIRVIDWIKRKSGWLKEDEIEGASYWRVNEHPARMSLHPLRTFLAEQGMGEQEIEQITARLHGFLSLAAVNGGYYAVTNEIALKERVSDAIAHHQTEASRAEHHLNLIIDRSNITMADFKSAYLTDDYEAVIREIPAELRKLLLHGGHDESKLASRLRNAMTRMLYHKTETQHFTNIKIQFDENQKNAALKLLHTRRNYDLRHLLKQTDPQEQRIARAFLILEEDFGNRCNWQQVEVFRGLLLDDKHHPDKIQLVQARMGFGKTKLMPIIALAKTNRERLVVLVVPAPLLEKNEEDLSAALGGMVGKRAHKDTAIRYQLGEGREARLASLRDAAADLKRRLHFYKELQRNQHILVQPPTTRNALQAQEQIFSDLLAKESKALKEDDEMLTALFDCDCGIKQIRRQWGVMAFDEQDATYNRKTGDVNYTTGEKQAIKIDRILQAEEVMNEVERQADQSSEVIAEKIFKKFSIQSTQALIAYVCHKDQPLPAELVEELSEEQQAAVFLCRGILIDRPLLGAITTEMPQTDFGLFFHTLPDGSKAYNMQAIQPKMGHSVKVPLLLAVPYSAAQTPKGERAQFENTEALIIKTLRYHRDPTTTIERDLHFAFLIEAVRQGTVDSLFRSEEEKKLLGRLHQVADMEDDISRREAADALFADLSQSQNKEELERLKAPLGRCVIALQGKYDKAKANSNCNEQGSIDTEMIGFSGTSVSGSSQFQKVQQDPGADGNMTIGIMGREENQQTSEIDLDAIKAPSAEIFTQQLVAKLFQTANENTRSLADAAGLCKEVNSKVAGILLAQLEKSTVIKNVKGVIFFDEITNTLKVMRRAADGKLKSDPYTDTDRAEAEKGNLFKFYDQSHCRGADIPQMRGAHTLLTLHVNVTNSDFKQTIMRDRKIIDPDNKQSYSTVLTKEMAQMMRKDRMVRENDVRGVDIAVWLRYTESAAATAEVPEIVKQEFEAILKNALLQQQARVSRLIDEQFSQENRIQAIKQYASFCSDLATDVYPFVQETVTELRQKYGTVLQHKEAEAFLKELKGQLFAKLDILFEDVQKIVSTLNLELKIEEPLLSEPYKQQAEGTIDIRRNQMPKLFQQPSSSDANSVAQAESQVQSQSQVQAQSQVLAQSQTYTFSNVEEEADPRSLELKLVVEKYNAPSLNFLTEGIVPASSLKELEHVLKDEKLIGCSPGFNRTLAEQKHPPIRFFLSGPNDLLFLIDLEEAELFKKNPIEGYALFDIGAVPSQIELKDWEPVAGGQAMRPSDAANTLLFLGNKFSLGTAEHLKEQLGKLNQNAEALDPHLHVQGSDNILQVLSIPNWGYREKEPCLIPVTIDKTEEKIQVTFSEVPIPLFTSTQERLKSHLNVDTSQAGLFNKIKNEIAQEKLKQEDLKHALDQQHDDLIRQKDALIQQVLHLSRDEPLPEVLRNDEAREHFGKALEEAREKDKAYDDTQRGQHEENFKRYIEPPRMFKDVVAEKIREWKKNEDAAESLSKLKQRPQKKDHPSPPPEARAMELAIKIKSIKVCENLKNFSTLLVMIEKIIRAHIQQKELEAEKICAALFVTLGEQQATFLRNYREPGTNVLSLNKMIEKEMQLEPFPYEEIKEKLLNSLRMHIDQDQAKTSFMVRLKEVINGVKTKKVTVVKFAGDLADVLNSAFKEKSLFGKNTYKESILTLLKEKKYSDDKGLITNVDSDQLIKEIAEYSTISREKFMEILQGGSSSQNEQDFTDFLQYVDNRITIETGTQVEKVIKQFEKLDSEIKLVKQKQEECQKEREKLNREESELTRTLTQTAQAGAYLPSSLKLEPASKEQIVEHFFHLSPLLELKNSMQATMTFTSPFLGDMVDDVRHQVEEKYAVRGEEIGVLDSVERTCEEVLRDAAVPKPRRPLHVKDEYK